MPAPSSLRISGAGLDAIYSDPRLLPIVRQMLQEGLALAQLQGISMPVTARVMGLAQFREDTQ
jgi:hypothetical protein